MQSGKPGSGSGKPLPARASAHGGVAALERGLALISVLDYGEGIGLSEASRRAGLNKTTAFRLLKSLVRLGFVHRDERDAYTLGPAIQALAETQTQHKGRKAR